MIAVPNLFGHLRPQAKRASKPRGKKQSANEDAVTSIPVGVPIPTSTAALAAELVAAPAAESATAWATEEWYPERVTEVDTPERTQRERDPSVQVL